MNITVRFGLFPLVRGAGEGGNPNISNKIFFFFKCITQTSVFLPLYGVRSSLPPHISPFATRSVSNRNLWEDFTFASLIFLPSED